MAAADIEVANLATNDTPPEAPEAKVEPKIAPAVVVPEPEPEQKKVPESDFYEPEIEQDRPPLYSEIKAAEAKPKPPVEPEEPKPEPKPEKPADPKAEAPAKHSAQAIQQAASLGIPVDEIDEMTPKQLQRAMDRMYAAYDAGKKTAPAPEVKKDEPKPEEDDLDALEKEGYDPRLLKQLRKAQAIEKQNKELQDQLEQTTKRIQSIQSERMNDRFVSYIGELGQEASKAFDQSTVEGQKNYLEMLSTMDELAAKEVRRGKSRPSDRDVLHMAVRDMGIAKKDGSEQDKAHEEALKKRQADRQEEWQAGALSKGGESRKKTESVHEYVREKLKKAGAPVSEAPAENLEVEWPE